MGGCWDMPLGAQHTGTLLWQAALACAPWPATPEEPVAGCMTVLAGRAKEVPRESDPTLGGQPCPTITSTNQIVYTGKKIEAEKSLLRATSTIFWSPVKVFLGLKSHFYDRRPAEDFLGNFYAPLFRILPV